MTNRQIEASHAFTGLSNFRDVGGRKTEEGRYVKQGVLYRSEDLSRLTEADVETMRGLGIRMVIDVRTAGERKSKPGKLATEQGITTVNLPFTDRSQELSRLQFFSMLTLRARELDFEKIMKDMYDKMAFDSQRQIQGVIALLAQQTNLPALIHCTGGKDRTGFLCAVIQLLLGVPYAQVLDDYLLSNDRIAHRMKRMERFIRMASLFQLSPERIKPLLEVRRDYLDDVIQAVLARHGTMEAYLTRDCQIDPKDLQQVKQLLLDDEAIMR
ncbi:tyrosine-protein phosphatase [Brevibacillus fluminis]|uniref:tyrosine-protein phosphatase n=1 Tax=Brevibacillus fluminis TaxID=511487 RepID=UPI003F89A9D5